MKKNPIKILIALLVLSGAALLTVLLVLFFSGKAGQTQGRKPAAADETTDAVADADDRATEAAADNTTDNAADSAALASETAKADGSDKDSLTQIGTAEALFAGTQPSDTDTASSGDVDTAASGDTADGADASAAPEHDASEAEEEPAFTYPENPDRVILREGFSKEPLTEETKARIDGVSYHENKNIGFDDLSFLYVLYIDFDGNEQVGELICNNQIADDLLEIFAALYDASYQIDKIRLVDEYGADDDLSCADDNTSCFNYRVVPGSTHLSKHARGLAIDINPFYNPYVTYPDGKETISPPGSETYADRKNLRPHMITEDDLCYKLFTEHGFTWGGHWKTLKDYQHFQISD